MSERGGLFGWLKAKHSAVSKKHAEKKKNAAKEHQVPKPDSAGVTSNRSFALSSSEGDDVPQGTKNSISAEKTLDVPQQPVAKTLSNKLQETAAGLFSTFSLSSSSMTPDEDVVSQGTTKSVASVEKPARNPVTSLNSTVPKTGVNNTFSQSSSDNEKGLALQGTTKPAASAKKRTGTLPHQPVNSQSTIVQHQVPKTAAGVSNTISLLSSLDEDESAVVAQSTTKHAASVEKTVNLLQETVRKKKHRRKQKMLQEFKCSAHEEESTSSNYVAVIKKRPTVPSQPLGRKRKAASDVPKSPMVSASHVVDSAPAAPLKTLDVAPTRRRKRKIASKSVGGSDTNGFSSISNKRQKTASPVKKAAQDLPPPPPTIDVLARSCWICEVDLQSPNNNDDDPDCMNVMHSHLVLQVPVCCVCAEEVSRIEQCGVEEQEGEEGCTGCAGDGFMLLCDTCPREYCRICVAKCHGGGKCGIDVVNELLNDESPWECPACSPPAPLLRLCHKVEQDFLNQADPSAESLLGQLYDAEMEKRRCEQEWEVDTNKRRDAERQELLKEDPTLSATELDEQVTQALSNWDEDFRIRERRLDDFIFGVLDKLDTVHEINPFQAYKAMEETTDYPFISAANPKEDPDWRLSADKALLERPTSYKCPDPLPEEAYDNDDFEDVEDLGDVSIDDTTNERLLKSGWRTTSERPSKAKFEKALEWEEKHNVQFQVVRDSTDKQAIQDEARVRRNSTARNADAPTASGVEMQPSLLAPKRSIAGSPSTVSSMTKTGAVDDDVKPSAFSTPLHSPVDFSITESGRKATPSKSRRIGKGGLLLCDKYSRPESGRRPIRTVEVSEFLAERLKPHQVEGIKFMWKNCFSDFEHSVKGDASQIGGCILAHSMGLGKSLSAVALIHAVMTQPSMFEKGEQLIKKVLLVVPVNTIANWVNEFEKWLGIRSSILVYNLSTVVASARQDQIRDWEQRGGVLLVSVNLLVSLKEKEFNPNSCDVLVMDEAAVFLKSTSTQMYKKLQAISTPRRIALTGSPLQNNLVEYYNLFNFVRRGILGYGSVKTFESNFVSPINKGMAKDAGTKEKYQSLKASNALNSILEPYVHRVPASVLYDDLPPISQIAFHVRQTRAQSELYQAFKKYRKKQSSERGNNFFWQYQQLRPIHNHPGSLLFPSKQTMQSLAKGDDGTNEVEWWKHVIEKKGENEIRAVTNSNKIVLLLHILALAQTTNEKVLVFTNSISTLNFIEYVLTLEDWTEHVPSLAEKFPGMQLGGWQKSKHFLRIDGTDNASDRGDRICQFTSNDSIKAFLLSSRAGGIGINLTSASRVVLIDTDFNPTVATQAVARAYRYGQVKPVFCYQFLTEGSMEERVNSRCINKTGLSYLVIDKKSIDRHFTASELANLMETLVWIQCDKCEKWRAQLDETSLEEITPDFQWTCEMNSDADNKSCEASEKSPQWYEEKLNSSGNNSVGAAAAANATTELSVVSRKSGSRGKVAVFTDVFLGHLLGLTATAGKKAASSKLYLRETLLRTTECPDELEQIEGDLKKEEELRLSEAQKKLLFDEKTAIIVDEQAKKKAESSGMHSHPVFGEQALADGPHAEAATKQACKSAPTKSPNCKNDSPAELKAPRAIAGASSPHTKKTSPRTEKSDQVSSNSGSSRRVSPVGDLSVAPRNAKPQATSFRSITPAERGPESDDSVIDLCSSDDE